MSPRRYQMQARSQAMAETRARIVRAATELHTERGNLATSWEEIAERAGVAPATVYRHFPSLVELIPACARSVFDVVAQPHPRGGGRKVRTSRQPDRAAGVLHPGVVRLLRRRGRLAARRPARDQGVHQASPRVPEERSTVPHAVGLVLGDTRDVTDPDDRLAPPPLAG
ncbi:MAG TPA: helix-turn-helix domain-containing protein [Actinomycetota bacterium]|nr:helix-turn-helix domain-containing protein [Actinomycetota bacterium]